MEGGPGRNPGRGLGSMPLLRAFTCLAVAAALLPAAAGAGVKLVVRDEPVGSPPVGAHETRALAARNAPLRFNMVGLHWKGSGEVWFRTALERGEWSGWLPARAEAEDGPDPGSEESERHDGWQLGSPYWTGAARSI